jgi:hypothetical protein
MKAKPVTIEQVVAELAALKAELSEIKAMAKVGKSVKATVDGPRRSEVLVDAQVIPMSGEFKRSGSRDDVELAPPTADVDVILKGQIGTDTTFTLEINGKTKKEQFVLTAEREDKFFTYPLSDFGF